MSSVLPLRKSREEFYDLYFEYVGATEAPRIFHRWCGITAIGAFLGRQCWLPFGHWTIYPNQYVMLMGSPGTRKDTAIKIAKGMIERVGYTSFAADRTSKEMFLHRMMSWRESEEQDIIELVLDSLTSEVFVVAGEFLDFVGKNNIEFLTMLGKLWDADKQYDHPKLHGKSVIVPGPTVNILSGNTPQNFMLAIPPESIGSGYISRNIIVHGDTTGVKITIPQKPSEAAGKLLDERLREIQTTVKGEIRISPEASKLLDRIYHEFKDIDDYRFKHYSTRRFTHLLKLCLLFTAVRVSSTIECVDCLKANTLLHYTEARMPKALGEFGKAKNSDVANSILEILKSAKLPVTARYLWKQVSQDLNRQEELQELLKNMKEAGKIQTVSSGDKIGYVTRYEKQAGWAKDLLIDNFLTEEEKM